MNARRANNKIYRALPSRMVITHHNTKVIAYVNSGIAPSAGSIVTLRFPNCVSVA
jgi:hypothetical protein